MDCRLTYSLKSENFHLKFRSKKHGCRFEKKYYSSSELMVNAPKDILDALRKSVVVDQVYSTLMVFLSKFFIFPNAGKVVFTFDLPKEDVLIDRSEMVKAAELLFGENSTLDRELIC